MKTYKIIFGKDKVPAMVFLMDGKTLTSAIKKAVKEIERMKAVFARNNVDSSHLQNLTVIDGYISDEN
jgi:hypothetical protein